jgi:hypothetical protein
MVGDRLGSSGLSSRCMHAATDFTFGSSTGPCHVGLEATVLMPTFGSKGFGYINRFRKGGGAYFRCVAACLSLHALVIATRLLRV